MIKDVPWAAIAGSPRFGRFRTRRSRRITVALYLSTLAALLLVTGFFDNYWPVLPLFSLSTLTVLLLHASTRGIAGLAAESLDEQQIAVRDAGYKASYILGVTTAFIGGFWVSAVSDSDTAFEAGLVLAVLGFVTGLPTLIVAWVLPGEAPDE